MAVLGVVATEVMSVMRVMIDNCQEWKDTECMALHGMERGGDGGGIQDKKDGGAEAEKKKTKTPPPPPPPPPPPLPSACLEACTSLLAAPSEKPSRPPALAAFLRCQEKPSSQRVEMDRMDRWERLRHGFACRPHPL